MSDAQRIDQPHIGRDGLEPIEVVNWFGEAIGKSTKLAAHERGGLLHRAISVFLLDAQGDLLIQRRAETKYHSSGTWTNTCCGHPAPGETPESAALRRLNGELGVRLPRGSLIAVGTILYEVDDPASGFSEREFDHLFIGRIADPPRRPNPEEVAAIEMLRLEDIPSLAERPEGVSPWFWAVTKVALPALLSYRAGMP